jgi:peptidyl-tRNA hydrolase, PTH1 family
MRLLVGLGNPGKAYAGNRHNIGFMLVDNLARAYSFSPWKTKFQGEMCEGVIAGEKIMLLKPLTYMNLSGQSVGETMRFYKIPLQELLVAHDELDLPFTKTRVKVGGGHAGHNGLRSITAHCTDAFMRVRLGIGHPGDKNLVSNYVLGDFSKGEEPLLSDYLHSLTKHFALLLEGKESLFLSRLAEDLAPKKTAP